MSPVRVRGYPLRDRIFYMRALVGAGGVFAFLGFLLVAYGFYNFGIPPPPPPSLCYGTCGPGLTWNQIIGIGVGLIGCGVLLVLLGMVIRGPSREWSEILVASPSGPRETIVAPGIRYACPGCGGDVYTSQASCPTCGHPLVQSAGM